VISLTINALGGNDTIIVNSFLPTLTTAVINGGTGSDSIFGPNTANTWNITGPNAGNVTGTYAFTFSDIENLTGGSSTDTFIFANNSASLSGNLDGDDGSDVLNYAARTTAVTVDLGAGTATGIDGIFSNIESLVGSGADDNLIGGDTANTWNLTGDNTGNINTEFTFSASRILPVVLWKIHSSSAVQEMFTGTVDGASGDDEIVFNQTNSS